MPTLEDRVKVLETGLKQVQGVSSALQGQPASSAISIPHNDSWLFEDNVDGAGGFPGNLRYIISANVQRVVSARLSIHLAPYRTYNSLTLSATGTASDDHHHTHSHGSHAHSIPINAGPFSNAAGWDGGNLIGTGGGTAPTNSATPSTDTTGQSATHTHSVFGSAALGVTEGAVATSVALSFDGVDRTTLLGGPFSVDVIELNVLPYLPLTKGVFHLIAMLPTGLGRIEAHLRLGVYVAAGSAF